VLTVIFPLPAAFSSRLWPCLGRALTLVLGLMCGLTLILGAHGNVDNEGAHRHVADKDDCEAQRRARRARRDADDSIDEMMIFI
jgi:hypothetical protein